MQIGNKLSASELHELSLALGARRHSERQKALRQARALSPEAILQLMNMNGEQYRRRCRREKLYFYPLMALYLGAGILYAWGCSFWNWSPDWGVRLLLPVLVQPILFGLTLEALARDNRVWRSLIDALADANSARFAAPLLELLSHSIGPRHRQKPLFQAVERLLPQLQASDIAAWTKEQRRGLIKPLVLLNLEPQYRNRRQYAYRVSLALRILKALEQIGEQLASIRVKTEKDHQLQQAAEECLPFLRIRADQHHQAKTLLRPSEENAGNASGTLLRAAVSNDSKTSTSQLLRVPPQPS